MGMVEVIRVVVTFYCMFFVQFRCVAVPLRCIALRCIALPLHCRCALLHYLSRVPHGVVEVDAVVPLRPVRGSDQERP